MKLFWFLNALFARISKLCQHRKRMNLENLIEEVCFNYTGEHRKATMSLTDNTPVGILL